MEVSCQRLFLAGSLALLGITNAATSFAQTSFNTISGKVWQDSRISPDGIMDSAEPGIAGVLVLMYKSIGDEIVMSSTISKQDGTYTIDNFAGEGEYFLRFHFPEEGYDVTSYRSGADNALNNAVSDLDGDGFWRTEDITIDAVDEGTEIAGYNLGLVMQANKIVYSTYKSSTSTEWNDTMSLPKSNASVGILSRVKLFLTDAAYHPSIGIENISNTSGSTGSIELGGKIVVTPPNGVVNAAGLNATSSISKSGVYPVFDGIVDYGGTSGDSWSNEFGAAYDDYNYPVARRADFEGTDSVKLPVVASSTVTISGGGNLSSNVTTSVAAGMFVIYEYDGGVLPVTLSSFEAKKLNNVAQLHWSTFSETNNKGFDVERSANAQEWTSLGFVAAKGGNSTDQLNYSFIDNMPANGANYYRLRQVDIDGAFEYSKIQLVRFEEAYQLQIFPNPTSANFIVKGLRGDNTIAVANLAGQVILHVNVDGVAEQTIQVAHLPAGTYFVTVTNDDGSNEIHKVVKD